MIKYQKCRKSWRRGWKSLLNYREMGEKRIWEKKGETGKLADFHRKEAEKGLTDMPLRAYTKGD